ncbi:MAG TPA: VOC family protein [Candidatus Dormibacteraeota bacterium]|jgi:PhnB protein|nr:VOC family protein [Candidatus Dormibacteraeota bacterium]
MPTVLTPYLMVTGAAEAIDFYTRGFGATELMRLTSADGSIGHAEMRIGEAVLMLSDEAREQVPNMRGPRSLDATTVSLHLLVPDVDAVVERAVAAGATLERPVADQSYGERTGVLVDPFGHRWFIATTLEPAPEGS